MSARACDCGKALDALCGKLADAVAMLDRGKVDAARDVLLALLGTWRGLCGLVRRVLEDAALMKLP
jgi:hypothetical protein